MKNKKNLALLLQQIEDSHIELQALDEAIKSVRNVSHLSYMYGAPLGVCEKFDEAIKALEDRSRDVQEIRAVAVKKKNQYQPMAFVA